MQFSGSAGHHGFKNLLGALLLWMQGDPFSVMSSFTNLRSPDKYFPGARVAVTRGLPGGSGHIIADNCQLFVDVDVDILLDLPHTSCMYDESRAAGPCWVSRLRRWITRVS